MLLGDVLGKSLDHNLVVRLVSGQRHSIYEQRTGRRKHEPLCCAEGFRCESGRDHDQDSGPCSGLGSSSCYDFDCREHGRCDEQASASLWIGIDDATAIGMDFWTANCTATGCASVTACRVIVIVIVIVNA